MPSVLQFGKQLLPSKEEGVKEVRGIFFRSSKSPPIEGIIGERGEGASGEGVAEVGCAAQGKVREIPDPSRRGKGREKD